MGVWVLDANTPISPDMVLGKPVVTARGENVGEVLDVGVHNVDRVKFLLVGGVGARYRDVQRVGVDLIESVGPERVVVRQK